MRQLILLGPARVEEIPKPHTQEDAGRAPLRFRSQRTVGLLGYLVSEQRPVARSLLATLFWPDEPSPKGRANLSRELHNLAQILPDCWESDRQAIAFVPSSATSVDIYQLRQLEASQRWGEATDLLGGEFLEGLYLDDNREFESWLMAERERWQGRAELVLRRVIEGYTRRGRYTEALHHARRLLQLAPWDEETHRQIIRFLAWTGRRGAALRQYDNCKHALREELGVEPALETTALCQQIQAGKLDLPPQLPAFLSGEKARRPYKKPPFVGREGELSRLDGFLDVALAGQGRIIFIIGGPGRGKTALLEAFARLAMKKHPKLLVASGRCNAYTGVGDPYLPFRDVLTMLTGDVEGRWDAGAISRDHAQRVWTAFPFVVQVLLDHGPHLLDVFVPGGMLLSYSAAAGQDNASWYPRLREHIKRFGAGTIEVEQNYLFQQVTNVLQAVAQEHPLLLILDDLQWADAASISLLFHLGRRLAENDNKLLIACAYRPEEVALGRTSERHPLVQILSEFKRNFGDVWVDLGRTDRREGRKFVDDLLDVERNRLGKRFRSALFDRTGGHPLFTVELLRAMKERGDLLKVDEADGAWIEGPTLDWDVLPARVEAVIEERIDRLEPEMQDILTVASVEGEAFTVQIVTDVMDLPERSTLRRLSQDLEQRHRLVKEEEEVETDQRRLSRYRFSHVLFQDYLYKRLCPAERRLLHGDVATALEKLHTGQLDEVAVQLAHHFYQAGDHNRAFHYSTLAAERAARLYESGEAITHYTRAIQLAGSLSPNISALAKLYRGRGLAFERLGAFEHADSDHKAALELARTTGEDKVAWRASLDLGRLWASRDYNQTREYFSAALDIAHRLAEPALLAVSLNWMGNWCANDDDPRKALAHHQKALHIFEDLGQRQGLANTLDLLGIASLLSGDLSTSVRYYDRAITLFRRLDDRLRLTSSLIGRATTTSMPVFLNSVPAKPPPDSASDFDEALQIASEIGSASDRAWAHWSLGLFHTMNGHIGLALDVVQSGLSIASEIGHREYVIGNRFALGLLYLTVLAPEQARSELEDVLALAGDLRSRQWVQLITGALVGTYLMQGDLASARVCLEQISSPLTPMDTLAKRYCWVQWAELALAQEDPALALDITERLITSAPGIFPGRIITYLWKLKADALASMGHTEQACPLLIAAVNSARVTGERFLLWRIHADLGRFYRTMGEQEAAEKEYKTAQTLISELAATIPDETIKEDFLHGARRILLAY